MYNAIAAGWSQLLNCASHTSHRLRGQRRRSMQRRVSLDIGRNFAEAGGKWADNGRHRQIAALSGGDGNDGVALFTYTQLGT